MKAGLQTKRAMPLHRRILGDIQELICSGAWQPGRRIPVEFELMRQYKCSRMTVSKVLTYLANERMIDRRPGIGSFVSRPHSQSAVLTIPDIKTEVMSLGRDYSFEVLHRTRRRGTTKDQQLLGVDTALSVLEIVCRHRAGSEPFCYEERLINVDAVPSAITVDFHATPPGTWLLHTVPWALAGHRIRAAQASGPVVDGLRLRPASPVLMIERTTRSAQSTPITYVKLAYPAELHEIVATFSPPGAVRAL